ncbi:MAG: hypothetical protein ACYDBV_10505 [Nitrospiria bacterium]
MKKTNMVSLFILFVSLAFTAYSALAATTARQSSGDMTSMTGPTRTITQEMGGVIKDGEVNVDLTALDGTGYYQPGSTQAYIPGVQINMGIWGGELRVGGGYGTERTPASGSIGYKFIAGPGAAYGRVNINRVSPSPNPPSKTGDVDLTLGYAFSQDLKSLIVNLNGEFTIDSDYADNGTATNNQSTTDLRLNGAILMPLISKLSFVGELGFDTNSNPTKSPNGNSASAIVLGAGLRLNPNSKVTVDGMVLSYATLSGGGRPYDSVSGIGTPVVLRANYQF